jgi:hypothetical protein
MTQPPDRWTLAVDRADLGRTRLTRSALPDLGPGEALLRVDRVGVTANNSGRTDPRTRHVLAL